MIKFKHPAFEIFIYFSIFLLSMCLGFVGIYSIFIPFLIPTNFNFFVLEDIKNLSQNLFNSNSILLYYLTIAASWLFISWAILNSMFMIGLTNVVVDILLDKEKTFLDRLLNGIFIIFAIGCTVALLVFVNHHTLQW